MYNYNDIKVVHLEVTEKCNASCLQCDRNKNGGEVNQYLKDRELSIANIMNIFKPDFIRNLDRMYMCGNYGEPICAEDTLVIFQYFKKCNPNINLGMNTNGSFRSSRWWSDIAKVLDYVKFSIDGLVDTNHLYRQNTSFKKIIKNATSFINSGGNAHWDYLIFAHNEHQVEEARQLSIDLGFNKFIPKKTGRFFSNIKTSGKDIHQGVDKKGNKTQELNKPKDQKNQNKALLKEQILIDKYGDMETYLNQTKIECKFATEKNIYVSAEGLVFPCCWLAGQLYKWYWSEKHAPIWDLLPIKDEINAKKYDIKTIINSRFFRNIKESWKLNLDSGKLKVCALKCGNEFKPFEEQFK